MLVEPGEAFQGTVLITVPHMDDCVLGCGGLIARLPDKGRVHVVYATDGTRSPAPILPWEHVDGSDLSAVRMAEARAALGFLGIPDANIRFLGLPEAQLTGHAARLTSLVARILDEVHPAHVFTPFRYDRHPDHLVLNRVVTAALGRLANDTRLLEYFVYHRSRLLPRKDVRRYIAPRHLRQVDLSGVVHQKRQALAFFKSQTTIYYPWQTRPNLTPHLLDEVSQGPELFLECDPAFPGSSVFASSATLIRLAHRLEPYLKVRKDQAVAVARGGLRCLKSKRN